MKKLNKPSATNLRKVLEGCFRASGWKVVERETLDSHLRTYMRRDEPFTYAEAEKLRNTVIPLLVAKELSPVKGKSEFDIWIKGHEWYVGLDGSSAICISCLRRTPEGDKYRIFRP